MSCSGIDFNIDVNFDFGDEVKVDIDVDSKMMYSMRIMWGCVALALKDIHKLQIIHRDIKSENALFLVS